MEKYTGFSGHASLAIVGKWIKEQGIWKVIEENVKIKQKVIKHSPTDKLKDVLIHILAGGQGIADVNQRVRTDKLLQMAFGRKACAEQSTIHETLDASTAENIYEFREALKVIYQKNGQGYGHQYESRKQVLDIDLSAMISGKQAEGASKGYFSGHKNKRGRQLGRVVASLYGEIISEKLYPGTVLLEKNLPELIKMAETVLDLDETRRKNTILRFDAGGGTDANINFLLERDYFGITKVKNWQRTVKLVKTVSHWQSIPHLPEHECGWVGTPHQYVRSTRQLAIRWPNKKKGGWFYSVIVFNLTNELVFELANVSIPETYTELDLLVAIVNAYDLRAGGVETSYKNSKQGIGLLKRNKKCFQAQELLVLLAQLAYNITGWIQNELALYSSALTSFGVLRMIRDAFQISGKIEFDANGNMTRITLNQIHKLAKVFHSFWHVRFLHTQVSFILGEI